MAVEKQVAVAALVVVWAVVVWEAVARVVETVEAKGAAVRVAHRGQ